MFDWENATVEDLTTAGEYVRSLVSAGNYEAQIVGFKKMTSKAGKSMLIVSFAVNEDGEKKLVDDVWVLERDPKPEDLPTKKYLPYGIIKFKQLCQSWEIPLSADLLPLFADALKSDKLDYFFKNTLAKMTTTQFQRVQNSLCHINVKITEFNNREQNSVDSFINYNSTKVVKNSVDLL